MYLGAHVKASGGVWKAIDEGERLGCEAIQIFAGSPRTWKPQLYGEADAARFREKRAASAVRFVVIHTIYLINLATARPDFYEKSVTALVGAVTAAEQLGCEAIVTHVGSHGGDGFEAGLVRVRDALSAALDEVGDSPVRVLLENTAGAGGTMGVSFDELAAMIDAVDGDPRVGICLDTAHLFEAGFDLRTRDGIDGALEALGAACGAERLVMLHLNDSRTPLGSNRDRHENIGLGELGLDAFRTLVTHPALATLPGIIEVPGLDGEGPDEANMQVLRDLLTDPGPRQGE
jgi:deoxyribonuclease IV